VAFVGHGSGVQTGIYTSTGGVLARVADTNTLNFIAFNDPTISGGTVAFLGLRPFNQQGIYTSTGGVLATVADTFTPIPGGTGNFASFAGSNSISGGTVAFDGRGSGGQIGIYISTGGVLTKVIASGDTLDGKTVSGASISDNSLDGSTLALTVGFRDNTGGIYEATLVPEPSSVVLILTGLVLTAAAGRSRAAGGV
jgi:hypothetical protein